MLSKFVRPAILLVLIIVLLGIFGIRVTHPQSGLRSALGSAKSTLVIYTHGNKVSVGNRAIVTTGIPGSDPSLVFIRGVEATSVDVQSQKILQRIDNKAVKGKLLLVIPYLGYIF